MWDYIGVKECNDYLLSLHLFDCEDERKYIRTLYAIANDIRNHYRKFQIRKNNGKMRTIYEPSGILKHIQKRILSEVLQDMKVSPYATAYTRGKSLLDNAGPHVGRKMILKLDIKNFFENIWFLDIYNSCFPIELFPKSVGMLFTYLCTYDDHLVQGAPTSAYISNLVMRDFDYAVGNWCHQQGIEYTRYSDDMTFSGDFDPVIVIRKVRRELYGLDMELNDSKTRVIYRSHRQCVTGVVVNEKPQVSREYRKEIRKQIHYIEKYGLSEHLKRTGKAEKGYMESLKGCISYVLQINPDDAEFRRYLKKADELLYADK